MPYLVNEERSTLPQDDSEQRWTRLLNHPEGSLSSLFLRYPWRAVSPLTLVVE